MTGDEGYCRDIHKHDTEALSRWLHEPLPLGQTRGCNFKDELANDNKNRLGGTTK